MAGATFFRLAIGYVRFGGPGSRTFGWGFGNLDMSLPELFNSFLGRDKVCHGGCLRELGTAVQEGWLLVERYPEDGCSEVQRTRGPTPLMLK